MEVKCICCFKKIYSASGPEETKLESSHDSPNDAIYFESLGNYGSTVFDGGEFTGEKIELYLCDECVKNKAHLILRHKFNKETNRYEYINTLNDYILGDRN